MNNKMITFKCKMNKEDFYYEVIEKVLKWTSDWDKFKNDEISVEPMSTQQLVEHLIKFENENPSM